MKKLIYLTVLIVCQIVTAQQDELPKSAFALHTGLLFGVWGNYEVRLGNRTALYTEAGLAIQPLSIFATQGEESAFVPVISTGPRWYYKSKERHHKSGKLNVTWRFLAATIQFKPRSYFLAMPYSDWAKMLAIFPSIGLKRQWDKHFVIEFAFGAGYAHFFAEQESWHGDIGSPALDIRLRFGFNL